MARRQSWRGARRVMTTAPLFWLTTCGHPLLDPAHAERECDDATAATVFRGRKEGDGRERERGREGELKRKLCQVRKKKKKKERKQKRE